MYNLEGEYDCKEFVVERRYKDFIGYREILLKNWPGFFIPPIPPKTFFESKEEGFVNMRMKYLQQFFNRIFCCPHLIASPETKIFLEPNVVKFLKVPKELYYKSYSEIYENYEEYLYFLKDYEINDKIKGYVNNFYFLVLRLKENIENYVNISIKSQNVQIELNRNIEKFYENFYDFDNFFIMDMMKVEKEKKENYNQDLIECKLTENLYSYNYENSFNTIYEWVIQELVDIEAMVESISSIYNYHDLFIKKFSQLQKENENLKKMNNPSFLKSFFSSTDLGKIQQKCFEVNCLSKEVEVIKKLSDFMYKIVFYMEIPIYKADKIKFYDHYLKYLYENEQYKSEKSNLIYEHLKEHSYKFLNMFKDYKEKNN